MASAASASSKMLDVVIMITINLVIIMISIRSSHMNEVMGRHLWKIEIGYRGRGD